MPGVHMVVKRGLFIWPNMKHNCLKRHDRETTAFLYVVHMLDVFHMCLIR
jgi:hypothetical protein